jgi:hypothetical protein
MGESIKVVIKEETEAQESFGVESHPEMLASELQSSEPC